MTTLASPSVFELDDEQQARIIDCLRKGAVDLTPESQFKFMRDIEQSIRSFLEVRARPDVTARQMHDELRDIWELSHEEDPPVGQLRARIQNLSQPAKDYLERRARRVIPALFPKERFTKNFQAWAKRAGRKRLVEVVAILSAEGGQLVARSRGGGKRSAPKLEPRILGQVRGAGEGPKGGRPEHTTQLDLIRSLASDWTIAAGDPPRPGRSDHGGFGDLVHSVFQWLEEPSADQALRRYRDEVEEGKARLAELDAKRAPAEVAPGFRQEG